MPSRSSIACTAGMPTVSLPTCVRSRVGRNSIGVPFGTRAESVGRTGTIVTSLITATQRDIGGDCFHCDTNYATGGPRTSGKWMRPGTDKDLRQVDEAGD